MSTTARIDELRKKFEENPRRYFAPLANEYRKAGELAQAIALCREHLPKQPGHMSGYIVFGQALYESAALAEARTVFEQALALDPENLIALRHLGDIAKAGGDPIVARRWYERVLDADPRNDDIAAQLASLSTIPGPSSGAYSAIVAGGSDLRSSFAAPTSVPFSAEVPTAPAAGSLTPLEQLRAVDFDIVNKRMARYTPLDLDAIEAGAAAPVVPVAEPFVAPPQPPHEGHDAPDAREEHLEREEREEHVEFTAHDHLDASPVSHSEDLVETPAPFAAEHLHADFEDEESGHESASAPHASRSVDDALGAFAAHDPSDELQSDEFEMELHPPTAQMQSTTGDRSHPFGAPALAASDLDDFEEGLVAPEWPVDADLIARMATPRSVTPTVVHTTPDAVSAFGREPHEPHARVEAERDHDLHLEITPPAAGVDPFGGTAPVAQYDEETATADDDHQLPWLSAPEDVGFITDSDRSVDEIATVLENDARISGDHSALTVTSVDTFHPQPEPIAAEASFAGVAGRDADDALDAGHEYAETEDEYAIAHDADHDADYEGDHDARDEFADSSPGFVTETMAELLVSQGFVARAVTVYEELVGRRPDHAPLVARLAELRNLQALADATTRESEANVRVASDYQTTHYTTPVSNTPQLTAHFTPQYSPVAASETPQFNPAITPVFSAAVTPELTPHFSASITPRATGSALLTPAGGSAAFGSPFLTARERFARLAAKRVPRRTPAAASPIVHESHEGLAALFGSNEEVPADDTAARAFADAFAPAPHGTGHHSMPFLDFSAGDDVAVRRAPTPRANPAANAAQNTGADGSNAGFSFDRFFPDPARAAALPTSLNAPQAPSSSPQTAAHNAPHSAADDVAPVGDDLAHFSAWLKGLGAS